MMVDAVGGDLGAAVRALRPREADYHEGAREQGPTATASGRRARARLERATSRARPTSENSTAATGPRRPRISMTRGNRVSSHSHCGCKKVDHALTAAAAGARRGRRRRNGLGGLDHEAAGAAVQRLHDLHGQSHAAELGQIALVQKFRQQIAVRGERGIRRVEQVVQKFFGGAVGGGDPQGGFDVLADDIGNRDGKFPARSRAAW